MYSEKVKLQKTNFRALSHLKTLKIHNLFSSSPVHRIRIYSYRDYRNLNSEPNLNKKLLNCKANFSFSYWLKF